MKIKNLLVGALTLTLVLLSSLIRVEAVSSTEATTGVTSINSLVGEVENVYRPSNADEFQAALDAAQPGETIELQAGSSYVGWFTLPVKSGSSYITIRSSALSSLPPENTRVNPSQASLMPKIASPGRGLSALTALPGAHHYRFLGIEFGPATPDSFIYELISLGDAGANQNRSEQIPHHLIFDRCYIHSVPGNLLKRGISLNSAETEITNSYISGFRSNQSETQAICGWNGPGPFRIINNYLEAASENILFGGADPSIPNLVPSDIDILRNYIAKPLAWVGQGWSVKNLLELKNAQRVRIDGNVFENSWTEAQDGYAVVLTPRNQDGTAPWSVVQDVDFTNNRVTGVLNGFNILGMDYNYPSQQTKRIRILNNLIVSSNRNILYSGVDQLIIEHNTFPDGRCIVYGYGAPSTNCLYRNNLAAYGYGVLGDNAGIGNNALNTYMPGANFIGNAFFGPLVNAALYPTGNYFSTDISSVGFADYPSGNYTLAATSPYRARSTDGKDIGCDWSALTAAMAGSEGTITPTPAPPPVVTTTPTPAPTPTPTPAPITAQGLNPNLYYEIISLNSSKALDVPGGSINSVPIMQWDRHGGINQRWRFVPVENGYYVIVSGVSSLVLDIAGASLDGGAQLTQYSYNGGDNQRWQLIPIENGYFKIISKNSGLALDVSGASTQHGASIIQWPSHNGNNQKWILSPLGPVN